MAAAFAGMMEREEGYARNLRNFDHFIGPNNTF
jgi:hypothetical protein